MKTYKLTIRPRSSFHTPLQSDTIFGHLLWALRYIEGDEGETRLRAFLDRYRTDETPPLLVSAGFPTGYLPAPMLKPKDEKKNGKGAKSTEKRDDRSTADKVVEGMLHKTLEDDRYLPLEQWHEIAGQLCADALKKARRDASEPLRRLRKAKYEDSITHTAVNRITGSALEGRLFVTKETFYRPDQTFDIWHRLDQQDPQLLERLTAWWRWIERNGFGQRKSAGRGAFEIVGDGLVAAGGELPHVENSNGFVTLSAWVPRKGDPTDVAYRTRVKRGKLGEALALPSPWKKPLLMLKPGAVARLKNGKGAREWYGRLVEDMHWSKEGIVQYGYAFPLPVCIKEGV